MKLWQVLVDDAVRLQNKYPTNGKAIAQQHETIFNAWEKLKRKSANWPPVAIHNVSLRTYVVYFRGHRIYDPLSKPKNKLFAMLLVYQP